MLIIMKSFMCSPYNTHPSRMSVMIVMINPIIESKMYQLNKILINPISTDKEIKKELPSNIKLVAATKTRSVDEIKQAVEAGINIIGENYVQEVEEKYKELKGKVKFHCIGHLQTNKVKKAVEIFDMIQTVDSIKIAKEID